MVVKEQLERLNISKEILTTKIFAENVIEKSLIFLFGVLKMTWVFFAAR